MKHIEEYIERLGQLKTINDSIYCRKLINLSIGANYDSDGLNFFLYILKDKMNDSKLFGIFIDLLSRPTWTKGEQLRFWMFYWSSVFCRARVYSKENGRGKASRVESHIEAFEA